MAIKTCMLPSHWRQLLIFVKICEKLLFVRVLPAVLLYAGLVLFKAYACALRLPSVIYLGESSFRWSFQESLGQMGRRPPALEARLHRSSRKHVHVSSVVGVSASSGLQNSCVSSGSALHLSLMTVHEAAPRWQKEFGTPTCSGVDCRVSGSRYTPVLFWYT